MYSYICDISRFHNLNVDNSTTTLKAFYLLKESNMNQMTEAMQ